jgi:hypothetical protein
MLISLKLVNFNPDTDNVAIVQVNQTGPAKGIERPLMTLEFDMTKGTHKITMTKKEPGISLQIQVRAQLAASDLIDSIFTEEDAVEILEI